MFAQLGDIKFEVLTAFTDYSIKKESNYAEHARIDGKPGLQFTGEKLDTVSFKIKLHHLIAVPEDEINKLNVARSNGQILPLVWGSGDYEGDFVIVSINVSRSRCNDQGDIMEAEIEIQLLEYFIVNKADQESSDARQKGFANSDNNPQVVTGKFGTLSEAQKAALMTSESKAEADRINSATDEAVNNPATRARRFKEVSKKVGGLKTKLEQLQKLVFDTDGLKDRTDNMQVYLRACIRAADKLKAISSGETPNVSDANQANQDLRNAMDLMQRSSSPIAGLVAIRKPI